MRAAVALLAIAAACAAAPAAAEARWERAPLPLARGERLVDLATAGDHWLALVRGKDAGTRAFASGDGGSTWRRLALSGPARDGDAASGPRGQLVAALTLAGEALLAVPDGDGVRVLARMPFARRISAPAWDAAGRAWIAAETARGVELVRLDSRLRARTRYLHASGVLGEDGRAVMVGRYVALVHAGGAHLLRDGRLHAVDEPVAAEGEALLTVTGCLSLDGGRSFSRARPGFGCGWRFRTVEGDPDVLVQVAFDDRRERHVPLVVVRRSPGVFRPVGVELPEGIAARWLTTSGLVVRVRDLYGDDTMLLRRGPLPRAPMQLAGSDVISARMLGRANALRAAAGIPPLLLDARIANAARGHSRYWTRNKAPVRPRLLDYHRQRPGRPGFTGTSPRARCRAAVTVCGYEVLFPRVHGAAAVEGWMASLYHRLPLTDAAVTYAGAGDAGGPAVLDLATPEQVGGVALRPQGFPSGTWSGPLAFPGREVPDPLAACARSGVHLRRPSVVVSFQLPTVVADPHQKLVERVSVRRADGGGQLAGCSRGGAFIGEGPLQPGTTYLATARFRIAPAAPVRVVRWRFTTA